MRDLLAQLPISSGALMGLVLALATVAALSGTVALLSRGDDAPGVRIVAPSPTPSPELRVYVTGAVGAPGVYTVDLGDRLADAVSMAGGLAEGADAESVNMAALARDESHFHVPTVEEVAAASDLSAPRGGSAGPPAEEGGGSAPSSGDSPPASASTARAASVAEREAAVSRATVGDGEEAPGPVDINAASQEDLQSLPGIGPSRARAIIEYREANGPFQEPVDITNVGGIGEGTYLNLRSLIYVGE